MEGYPWIKLYRDIGDDSKMKRLTSDEFMLWIIMMTKVDSDGFLFLAEGVPYNSEDLSLACNNFRKSIDDGVSIVETALKKFTSMKMISIKEDGLVCLLNFKARQEKNLTEAERQAKSRENKKNHKQEEPCHTDVTPMSRDSVTHVTEVSQESHPKIEDIRLKNKELEIQFPPIVPPLSEGDDKKKEEPKIFNFQKQNPEDLPATVSKKKRDRGVRVNPDTFFVTDKMRDWARKKGIEHMVEAETEKFLDRHSAKGTKHEDWEAAWRYWMGNAMEWSKNRSPPAIQVKNSNSIDSFFDKLEKGGSHDRTGNAGGFEEASDPIQAVS